MSREGSSHVGRIGRLPILDGMCSGLGSSQRCRTLGGPHAKSGGTIMLSRLKVRYDDRPICHSGVGPLTGEVRRNADCVGRQERPLA